MRDCGFKWDTTYTDLPPYFFSHGQPDTTESPQIVITNNALAQSLGIDLSRLNTTSQAQLFTGSSLPAGARPFSQAYAGHQFGHFTMLGDGRAHIPANISAQMARYDIQFKGSVARHSLAPAMVRPL